MAYEIKSLVSEGVYNDLYEIATSPFIDWERLKGSTILITGAGGFIGSHLTMALMLRNDLFGDEICIMANVRNKERAGVKYGDMLKRFDLSLNVSDVSKGVNATGMDFIIHAASQASNIQFENDPVGTINANLSGTENVLELAKANGAVTLIVSSLKVYGALSTGNDRIYETDIGVVDHTSYKNCYAIGKRASETLAASYAKQYGMPIKIARPSYIYGASSLEDDRVWAQFIANIVRKQDILLKSSGAPLRSFCYVTDTCTALLKIMLDGENATPYNIANPASDVTIRGFAKAACEVFPERDIHLSFANKEDEAEPVQDFSKTPEILDSTRLKGLGWEPKVDLHEGIRRAVGILEAK
ncbi:MAG: NAD-dependent epimerase/dehydratase family protein [Ruminococcus sp.]|nr:NAD-dependent epimerase/dehydratase family protein [Ruminococcus sp.]